MASVTFTAFVDDAGNFALDKRESFYRDIEPFKGCEVVGTLKKKTYRHGNQQLRYLRGVVIPDIAKACGYIDPEDWPDVYNGLMWKFFRLPDGQFGEPRRESCAKDRMSTERLTEVIDTLITYAETTIPDCRIRRPEEVDLDNTYAPDFDEEAA